MFVGVDGLVMYLVVYVFGGEGFGEIVFVVVEWCECFDD